MFRPQTIRHDISSALTHAEASAWLRASPSSNTAEAPPGRDRDSQEVSGTLHFTDILQSIARKLGEAFGLDRVLHFPGGARGKSVRLVASYEDPTIRNYVVDLERYPS